MMGAVITHKGLECVSAEEVGELISSKEMEKQDTVVTFSIVKESDLCTLAYRAQSVFKVMYLFGVSKASKNREKTLAGIKEILHSCSLDAWISKETPVSVVCAREGEHDYRSVDIGSACTAILVELLKKQYKFEPKIAYKDPEVIISIYIYAERCYIGVDFTGIDVSRREYKLFASSHSVKGTMAYGLVRLSGYRPGEVLLDPFTGPGLIPIEAAIFASGFPLNYYRKTDLAFVRLPLFKEKDFTSLFASAPKDVETIYGFDKLLKYVKSAQKNAKIAGVKKQVVFRKLDIGWLDTKFNKGMVDKVVTLPPQPSKRVAEGDINKLYRELFYQLAFVLSKDGKALFLTKEVDMLKRMADEYDFKLQDEQVVYAGHRAYKAISFTR